MTLAAQLIGVSMLVVFAAYATWQIRSFGRALANGQSMDDDTLWHPGETGTGLDTYVPPLALFGSSHSQSDSSERKHDHG